MKLQNAFLTLIILFVSSQVYFGQEKQKAELIDEFGKICSEDLMARYDGFMNHLQNDPSAQGYIIFYGDSSVEGRNLKFIHYLTEYYPVVRGFDKSRLRLLRGANRNQMSIQFWVVPSGAITPKPNNEFTSIKITSTTLYDKNWADFNNWSGEINIYSEGFLELGCEFSPNRNGFATILLSNADLTGYLIIYTKFGKTRKHADKIAGYALKELTKTFKIPQNRLKTIYGGNRQEPEIEFWFVPSNDKPPIPAPDKKTK
jgi:hypothetical protein